MTSDVGEDRYYSIAELCAYSGLSRQTLVRHLNAARDPLPHYKIGARVLVRRSEFDTWVQRVSAPGATPAARSFEAKVREAAASLARR